MTDRPGPTFDAEFEARVADWLELRGRPDDRELAAVRATIASLPAGRTRRGPLLLGLATAAAAVVAIGGLALGGRLGSGPGAQPAGSTDPAAWADDPRLAACATAHVAEPAVVFEMTYAQWFPLYFPGWSRGAPELEVDDPALVVIGREGPGPATLGGRPTGSFDPADRLAYQMCIAVGPPSDATVHDYGWTHFDRVVPVLSAADVARAAHLDPDVLADPAAWRFPERLAPCGGRTGNELHIFEIAELRDFPRSFPAASWVPAFDDAASAMDPGIVIVYRDPLPLVRRAAGAPTGQPGIHDLCVVFTGPAGDARFAVLPDVDITGFHVRLDGPAPGPDPIPTDLPAGPTPTPAGPTPTPGPAWAGDPTAALEGDDPLRATGETFRGATFAALVPDDERLLRFHLQAVRAAEDAFPVAAWVERIGDRTASARLHVVLAPDGRAKAAIVVSSRTSGSALEWVVSAVAACDPSELDPSTPTGRNPVGIWTDASGIVVPPATLRGTFDCYDGTQVRYRDRLYVRTPFGGVDESQLEASWAEDVEIPSTARGAPVRSGVLGLFVAADGSAIYIGRDGRGERLPHVIGDEVGRTDCN
jgi:hypothetical protein